MPVAAAAWHMVVSYFDFMAQIWYNISMEELKIEVNHVIYTNAEDGYSVLRCKVKGLEGSTTVVGKFPEIYAGSALIVTGDWIINKKYGQQFAVERYEEVLPTTIHGIEKYLSSGLIKGIGAEYARRIVRTFGAETMNIINNEPDRLLEVSGIGAARLAKIKESWEDQKKIRDIMIFLQSHDISTGLAIKIYKAYGDESIEIVTENPYRIAEDIWGIGFKTADDIAGKLGFGKERYERLRSGVLYTLNRLGDDGHCYATRDSLLKKANKILEVDESLISMTIDSMISERDVIAEDLPNMEVRPDAINKAIYLPAFYYSEKGAARRLAEISGRPNKFCPGTDDFAKKIEKKTGIAYDPIQLEAIRTAVTSKIMILTGGPGTGKTTTTLGIITAFRELGANILLAAPTGRAAKRLSEATGLEAKTIHRLLEAVPPAGFKRDADYPLKGDVLIVDECSMIDIMLMYSMLKAVPDHMNIVMVGDIDQLPSVGAGNVLRDIIDSGCFPVIRLTKIFRQAQTSKIIMNAHRINKGDMPEIDNKNSKDFFFIDMDKWAINRKIINPDPSELADYTADEIVDLVSKRLTGYYNVPVTDIQVLTPMKKGASGTMSLNKSLQEAINPGTSGIDYHGYTYRVNDKVMQLKNNYEKEVFNGDIGYIRSINMADKMLTVDFDGFRVEYDIEDLDELALAYATTIHKSQGSEYPVVVIPLLTSHWIMLQRNLIYTGITRAKKGVVIIGSEEALERAVRNMPVDKRNTMLKERIAEMQTSGGHGDNLYYSIESDRPTQMRLNF